MPHCVGYSYHDSKQSCCPAFHKTRSTLPLSSQAIRDGVIEASINHEKGYVQSKETMDIYGTREPQLAFHQRISFCLDIHNMSVKVSQPTETY